jgi:hypothetical protein
MTPAGSLYAARRIKSSVFYGARLLEHPTRTPRQVDIHIALRDCAVIDENYHRIPYHFVVFSTRTPG